MNIQTHVYIHRLMWLLNDLTYMIVSKCTDIAHKKHHFSLKSCVYVRMRVRANVCA